MFALLVSVALVAPLAAAPARAQSTLSAIEEDVERIARRARPCVLTVIAQRSTPVRPGAPRRTANRVGSGVAVTTNGVLTTASVVLGAEHVYVVTDNHLQVEARVVGMDPVRNLALLRADDLELSSLPLANKPGGSGDWVIAMGSSYRASPTQSVGTVALRFEEPGTSLLQLTNEVYPGNSGGAALNSRGELLGLVQGELGAPEAPGQRERAERRPGGMSFAIPIDVIVPFLDDLAKYQRVRHGLFGVSTRGAFVNGADPSDRIPIGALVEAVQPGGPASRLGLKKGDLIVAFNGERVEYPEQLARWVAVAGPGATISLVWVRDEIKQEGRTKLDEAPSAIPSWMSVDSSSSLSAGSGPGGMAADAPRDRRPSRAPRENSQLADTTSR
ncbi:MAG TPA: S1C family serine protease [Methylomirabilota bacterium]|nr:S1C family serine protease [Methylomirabilota bacterium]